jgi:hypothetical protein
MSPIPDQEYSQEESRRKWFTRAHIKEQKRYAALNLSSHGLLLQLDVERAFVAGAWASTVVMAQAVIEATVRDLETQDYSIKAKRMFEGHEDLERVRTLRNELLHPQQPGSPSIVWIVPGGDYSACHAALEDAAKLAVHLMFRAIYAAGKPKQSLKPAP